jgi:hypothetical protein
MSINKNPCGKCHYHDPQFRMEGKNRRYIHSFCAKLSKYPAKDVEGKVFPPDVQRVGEDEAAQMVIVDRKKVVAHCIHFLPEEPNG